ncbi:MAG TPA: hypothetical protein DEO54_09500 [Rikenellaceae bacterium]|nr:MAG: hypothetical protein A2X20_08865 [Bacteroidetes bacterium GWE2_40_15]HBZ26448.1 hypothetical protein [Rikenellaceae bacterium]
MVGTTKVIAGNNGGEVWQESSLQLSINQSAKLNAKCRIQSTNIKAKLFFAIKQVQMKIEKV